VATPPFWLLTFTKSIRLWGWRQQGYLLRTRS
jgi:hypothetical protein